MTFSHLLSSYWKWESIFGRFTLSDWDPIKKDNIVGQFFATHKINPLINVRWLLDT